MSNLNTAYALNLNGKIDAASDSGKAFNIAASALTLTGSKSDEWATKRDTAATIAAREFGIHFGTSAKARNEGALVELFESAGYETASAKSWSTALGTVVDKWNVSPVDVASIHKTDCKCREISPHIAASMRAHGSLTDLPGGEFRAIFETVGCVSLLSAYQNVSKAIREAAKAAKAAKDADGGEDGEGGKGARVDVASIDSVMAGILKDLERVSDMLKADTGATVNPDQLAALDRIVSNVGKHAGANRRAARKVNA